MTKKLLASLLLFIFLSSPLEAAFAFDGEPTPQTSENTVHLMLVHIFVDDTGGILGIAPITDDFFLWAYAPFVLSPADISDLKGYWKFDGGYTDASTNANTLTGHNSPVFATDVAFSSGGTITTSTTTTYTYATTSAGYQNPHAVTQITPATAGQATTTFVYDNNGNLTQSGTVSGTTTYAWDYRNRLTGSATSTVSGTTTYAYDQADQRVRKSDKSATTTYIGKFYDLTTSTATSSASTTAYIWAGDMLVATVEGNGYATSTYFVHPDHLGSTNVITNASGTVKQVLDYYPFGEERINTNSNLADRTFINQFYDREQSLSYLNARYYQNSRGQFLSEDPVFWEVGNTQTGIAILQDPQLLNSYSYAAGNPIVGKDTDGRLVELVVRPVNVTGAGSFGHAFLRVTPANSQTIGNVIDSSGNVINTNEAFTLSAFTNNFGVLFKEANREPSVQNGKNYGSVVVDAPGGLSEEEFDKRVVGNYNSLPNILSPTYGSAGVRISGSPNSNNAATSYLVGTGVNQSQVYIYRSQIQSQNGLYAVGLGQTLGSPSFAQSAQSSLNSILTSIRNTLAQLQSTITAYASSLSSKSSSSKR